MIDFIEKSKKKKRFSNRSQSDGLIPIRFLIQSLILINETRKKIHQTRHWTQTNRSTHRPFLIILANQNQKYFDRIALIDPSYDYSGCCFISDDRNDERQKKKRKKKIFFFFWNISFIKKRIHSVIDNRLDNWWHNHHHHHLEHRHQNPNRTYSHT